MTSFDSKIAAALHALELDVRERVAGWLNGLEDTARPGGDAGIKLRPAHFTCRLPSARFKEQAIVVQVPEWRLGRQLVEVALEAHAAGGAHDRELAYETDALVWQPLAKGCAAAPERTTLNLELPQLCWSPHEVIFRVPSLVMNPAVVTLDLPARGPRAALIDAVAIERLEQDLRCAGRKAQARIAGAVASLFREALRDLLNLRSRTLAAIDAAACIPIAAARSSLEEPCEAPEVASYQNARQALIAAFGHEADALERQAAQLVADMLEGLTLRAMDVSDITEARDFVVALRHRPLGALRLHLRSDTHGPGRGAGSSHRADGPLRVPDDSSTPHRKIDSYKWGCEITP